jgi:Restriction endonuclease
MGKAGSEYEHEAAAFFRSLGLDASVKQTVQGARWKHEIDVWVTGTLGAFPVRWAVECKDWATNVPKEKVLALQAIVQDIGAERGWLISEIGFQGGAVHCAENTNITLTSLKCLREEATEYYRESQIKGLLFQVEALQWDLQNHIADKGAHADPKKGFWHPPSACYETIGRLSMFEQVLKRGLHSDYPIVCDVMERDGKEVGLVARTDEELNAIMGKTIQSYRQVVENAKKVLEEDEI